MTMNGCSAAIEVERLSKRYGRKTAVDDVSFTVAEGEIFGLLGRNGAGKSTTVDCLAGLRVPDRGGSGSPGSTRAATGRELRQLLGVQLQESQLPGQADRGRGHAAVRVLLPAPGRHRRGCWRCWT